MNSEKGSYFKNLREKKGLEKGELAKILKISESQIDILEKGEFWKLPNFVLKEIVNRYQKFFKISEEEIKNIIGKNKEDEIEFELIKETKSSSFFNIFQNFPFIFLILFILIFVFIYQIYELILPPKITIIYPPNNTYLNEKQILIKGYVDKRSILYINREQIFYDKNGYFEKIAFLKPGLNRFIIEAINYLGVKNSKILDIYYVKY